MDGEQNLLIVNAWICVYSCAKKGTLTVVTTTAILRVAFRPSVMGKPYLHFEIGVRMTKKVFERKVFHASTKSKW